MRHPLAPLEPDSNDYKIYWMGGPNCGWYVEQCGHCSGPFSDICLAVASAYEHAKENDFIPGFWRRTTHTQPCWIILSGGYLREAVGKARKSRG